MTKDTADKAKEAAMDTPVPTVGVQQVENLIASDPNGGSSRMV